MPNIRINGQLIKFPNVNQDPNWAPELVKFGLATEDAFDTIASPGDIPATNLDAAANPANVLDAEYTLPEITFLPSQYRGFVFNYNITKKTDDVSEFENGVITAINEGGSFVCTREGSGDAHIEFSFQNDGLVKIINKSVLAGANYQVILSYRATAFKNN